MKKQLSFLALGVLLAGQAHSQSSQPALDHSTKAAPVRQFLAHVEGKRGADHREWLKIERVQSPDGSVEVTTNLAYVELASGMHYWEGNQWKASDDTIEAFPGGAVVRKGQQKVIFAPNAAAAGAVDMEGPDGTRLRSHVVALCYMDKQSGRVAMLAYVKSSEGEIRGRNQVVYPNAFDKIQASLRYSVKKNSFEQDVILHETPPTPESLGFNPETTYLTVLTEFDQAPTPVVAHRASSGDESLKFGALSTVPGKAFSVGEDRKGVPVIKKWAERDGRKYLFEEVHTPTIKRELEKLPAVRTGSVSPSSLKVYDSLEQVAIPKAQYASAPPQPLKVVKEDKPRLLASGVSPKISEGFVIDYQFIYSSINDYTFQGDTTYYISGELYASGTTTLEGGAVLKYDSGSFISVGGPFVCKTGPYRPAVLTAKDDDSVGETIDGSGGFPERYSPYALCGLNFYNPPGPVILHDLRICYADSAIGAYDDGTYSNVARNIQFYNVQYGLGAYYTGTWKLENILAVNVGYAVAFGYGGTFLGAHWTVANAWQVGEVGYGSFYLTNSLLKNITNAPPYGPSITGASNYFVGDVFSAAGAGSYYLATNSPYRNAGTTNIDPGLLGELKKKTTYPPIEYSNVTFTNELVLSPQACRDTDAPDLGYHYDPLDYLVSCNLSNATLILTNGTAVGFFNGKSLGFTGSGQFISTGTANNRNVLAHYSLVQERPLALGSGSPNIFGSGWLSADFNLNFTSLFFPQRAPYEVFIGFSYASTNAVFSIRNCEVYGAGLMISSENQGITSWCNNLFQYVNLPDISGVGQFTIRNNSFIGPKEWDGFQDYGLYASVSSARGISDNAFAGGYYNGSSGSDGPHHNAYLNGAGGSTGTGDLLLTNFVWVTGALGDYYQPTNSQLLNVGSTNANLLGLYHYTSTTNQVKETNSTVNIGYHYVAVGSDGSPQDWDSDGVPDYLEDTNGDGTYNSGDWLNWLSSDTDGDGVADGLELLLGRNPNFGTAADSGGVARLKTYTPLR